MADSPLNYTKMCGCGQPLHYVNWESRRRLRNMVAERGPMIRVTVTGGASYLVPRHYVALHGLREEQVALLVDYYGWPQG